MGRKQTNQTHNRRAKNRKAFDDVITHYETCKYKSLVKVMDTSKDNFGTPNNAAPSVLDFICDVEQVIEAIVPKNLLQNFTQTYIMGYEELDQQQKNNFEQRIGRLFIVRCIWPVNKYFFALRKKIETS